ncbi:MAG: DnaD domain protein [Mycoplasmoidaceae bacterium]
MSKIVQYSYFYKTQINFSPNLVNLSLLYKPIIGNDAYVMYCEMVNDSKTNSLRVEKKRSLYDFFKHLDFDTTKFHQNRKILESLKLLKTYFDDSNKNEPQYYFILNPPLEFEAFFSNLKFKKLLSFKLPPQKFKELEFIFNETKISNYAKDISVEFDDLFKEEINLEHEFNFEELYSRISNLSSTNVTFSNEAKNIINAFFKNYPITINDIEASVLNAIVKRDSDYCVDEILLDDALTQFINKHNDLNFYEVININRSKLLYTDKIDQEELNKIFLDYKNIKPEQYLVSIQKQQLDSNEIIAFKTFRRDLYLSDPIINVILDFSLRKTHGKINMAYIKKVAKTISINNLDTVVDVYQHLLNSTNKAKVLSSSQYQIKSVINEDEYDLVEIDFNN